GNEDDAITLTGVANDTKNDRAFLKYKWIFDDGNESDWLESPTTKHVYTMVGNYHVTLLVRDPKGAESAKTLNVTITNVPPVADFTSDVGSTFEDKWVAFDASTSFDTESDNEHLKFIWDFGDETIGTGKTIRHKYYKAYKYDVKLSVKDDDSATAEISKRIIVENQRPDAKLIIKGGEYKIDEIIRFYGYKSTDSTSDKRNLTYRWDFGDGKYSTGINTTHKYREGGEYTIRLRVSDDDGETDEARANIRIKSIPIEEDIYTNPTIENKGVFIYTGVVIVIIIMFIILFSLVSTYKGKKTLFGKLKDKLEVSKGRKKQAQDQGIYDPRAQHINTGMTPEQERFFTDYYGISPQDFMHQQQTL
ncbi:MAG: PKD domain-containing protein, partial [Thermoplasmata archaeon]|nr:PKD domain-containing protein [Thermoplasmata archaeon]